MTHCAPNRYVHTRAPSPNAYDTYTILTILIRCSIVISILITRTSFMYVVENKNIHTHIHMQKKNKIGSHDINHKCLSIFHGTEYSVAAVIARPIELPSWQAITRSNTVRKQWPAPERGDSCCSSTLLPPSTLTVYMFLFVIHQLDIKIISADQNQRIYKPPGSIKKKKIYRTIAFIVLRTIGM